MFSRHPAFIYTLATSQSTFNTSSSHIWTCRAYSCPQPAVQTCTTTTTTEAAHSNSSKDITKSKAAKLLGKAITPSNVKQERHQQLNIINISGTSNSKDNRHSMKASGIKDARNNKDTSKIR
jgi:hypothetical protein